MNTSLAGKVALITGGSKGIGAAISQRLAALGASVAINYSSDRGAADEVVSKIGAERAVALQADASSVKDIEGLVKETVAKFKKIDILVACAGILLNKDLENTSEEDFDRTMALNVKGPFFLAQVRDLFFHVIQDQGHCDGGLHDIRYFIMANQNRGVGKI